MWSLLGIFLLLWQPLTWRIDIPIQFWYKQAILFAMLLGLFYFNTRVLIPRLLNQHKILVFIVVNVGLAFLVSFVIQKIEVAMQLREYMNKAFRAAREGGVMKREEVLDHFALLIALIILGISTIIATVQTWQRNLQVHEELEKQRVQSELSFLKAQINPHFFFNTLNNIYALTQINHEAAGEAVHKLSRMMRYVLYNTLQDKVMLGQEIAFLKDYVELMKLRLTSNLVVTLETPDPVNEVPLAPMLFLPFIENAFKHGASTTQSGRISIRIRQQQHRLHLEVENPLYNEKNVTLEESNGIGLVNTRRRLDLLYAGRYELEIISDAAQKRHTVHLKLDVS